MYTGELINELLENVQDAERKVFIKVTVVRNPAPAVNTYMYEFGREELTGVA